MIEDTRQFLIGVIIGGLVVGSLAFSGTFGGAMYWIAKNCVKQPTLHELLGCRSDEVAKWSDDGRGKGIRCVKLESGP